MMVSSQVNKVKMSDKLLSLKWNSHMANFRKALAELQQKELYTDATLVCSESFFPVHKFVLSTCSDYFFNIFKRTPCKHPFIIIKDISPNLLGSLLNYMYAGEVKVSQDTVPKLLSAAEALQVKGLSGSDDAESTGIKRKHNEYEKEEDHLSLSDSALELTHISKNLCMESQPRSISGLSTVEKSSEEDVCIKDEPETGEPSWSLAGSPLKHESYGDSTWLKYNQEALLSEYNGAESSQVLHDVSSRFDGGSALTSDSAGFISRQEGYSDSGPRMHPCHICPKRFQSHADVVRHLRTHTGEKPFSCPHCDYRAAQKGTLKSHIMSRHSQIIVPFGQ